MLLMMGVGDGERRWVEVVEDLQRGQVSDRFDFLVDKIDEVGAEVFIKVPEEGRGRVPRFQKPFFCRFEELVGRKILQATDGAGLPNDFQSHIFYMFHGVQFRILIRNEGGDPVEEIITGFWGREPIMTELVEGFDEGLTAGGLSNAELEVEL